MTSAWRTRAPFVLERLAGGTLRTAHRGASRLAPDNTLEAIEAARHFDLDFVEVDAHRTRDGQVLLWHDAHLVTPDGMFEIAAHTLADLRSLELPDGVLATLPEAIEVLRGHCGIMIDLKAPALHEVLARDLSRAEFREVLVCGEYDDTLARLKHDVPDIAVSLTPSAAQYPDLAAVLADRPHLDALTVYWRTIGPRLMTAARGAGTLVLAWTVDHAHLARHVLRQGVHGVTSNDVELLAALRENL